MSTEIENCLAIVITILGLFLVWLYEEKLDK